MMYSVIFNQKHHDTTFISIGSCNEIEDIENQSVNVISNVLKHSQIIKFVDKDDKSVQEIKELKNKGIKTLSKRHIENYLLDDEIITKLCGNENKIEDCLEAKKKSISDSILRGNPPEDVKSASGQITTEIRKMLSLSQSGNNTSSFLRDTMAPLITEETNVYKDLERQIFK